MHTFAAEGRHADRGIAGMCLDGDGNVIACAGSHRSGPGPLIYVFAPGGAVLETIAFPEDLPMRCAFGGRDLADLYVTTGGGHLYRIGNFRKGFKHAGR